MVWKQDLAHLKQQLKSDQEPPVPPPKPIPPPLPSQSLEDADLLFLRAMGGVAVPPAPPTSHPMPETEPDSSPAAVFSPISNTVSRVLNTEESSSDFSQALGDLKGLRPLSKNPVFSAQSPPLPSPLVVAIPKPSEFQTQNDALLPLPIPDESPADPSIPDASAIAIPNSSPQVPHARPGPALMHLAAGMAIEVDGTLDLRRHSLNDAKERLKERIRDGLALRWRTILVTLGPNEALKQGFLAFLTTPQAQFISRYAQAPIPMGGAQAWVLYLGQATQAAPKDDA